MAPCKVIVAVLRILRGWGVVKNRVEVMIYSIKTRFFYGRDELCLDEFG